MSFTKLTNQISQGWEYVDISAFGELSSQELQETFAMIEEIPSITTISFGSITKEGIDFLKRTTTLHRVIVECSSKELLLKFFKAIAENTTITSIRVQGSLLLKEEEMMEVLEVLEKTIQVNNTLGMIDLPALTMGHDTMQRLFTVISSLGGDRSLYQINIGKGAITEDGIIFGC